MGDNDTMSAELEALLRRVVSETVASSNHAQQQAIVELSSTVSALRVEVAELRSLCHSGDGPMPNNLDRMASLPADPLCGPISSGATKPSPRSSGSGGLVAATIGTQEDGSVEPPPVSMASECTPSLSHSKNYIEVAPAPVPSTSTPSGCLSNFESRLAEREGELGGGASIDDDRLPGDPA